LEQTDICKLLPLMTLTKACRLALKSGTTPEVILNAAMQSGYTRAGGYHALRNAGLRTRKVRSDKGLTLKRKIDRLMEQAKVLEAKLSQDSKSDPGQQ